MATKYSKLAIFEEIQQQNYRYNNGYITLIDGLTFSQWQTLKKIEFYSNSKYISGDKDELGRDKPFYNIVNYRCSVAVRATDLDVKDIKITSDNPEFDEYAFIYNHEAYEWMKDSNFSLFLNDMGQTRPRYGGVLVKKSMIDFKLEIAVVPWKNVITDPIDIAKGIICEKHYMLPNELAEKRGVWENIDEALKLGTKQQRNQQNGQAQVESTRIPVYEISGVFPEYYDPDMFDLGDYTDDSGGIDFKRMRFIVAGEDEDQVLLYKEDLDESMYKYLSWEKVPGRGLGRGIVEEGFEAQKWTNQSVMDETQAMTLAGKSILNSDDPDVAENAITDLVNGSIIKHKPGTTIQSLQLLPSALPQFENIKVSWDTQIQRATSTFDAVTGETMPAGTPLGSLAIQAQQASSYFDYKREESGIFVTEIFVDWVLPYLANKINKAHILNSEFSAEELVKIDEGFANSLVNEQVKKKLLYQGSITTPQEYLQGVEFIKQNLSKRGKRRFLDIPSGYYKNFKPKVSVIVTKELQDTDAMKASLDYISKIFAANPAAMQNPVLAKIITKQAELSGILSPGDLQAAAQQAQSVPQGGTNIPDQPTATAAMRNAQSVLPQAQQ